MTSAAVARLAAIPGIGTALARRLVRRKFTTRRALKAIASELPPEARAYVCYPVKKTIPGDLAKTIARALAAELRFCGRSGPNNTEKRGLAARRYPVIPVGSVRRGAPRAKDLDLLVVVPDASHVKGLLSSARLCGPLSRAGRLRLVEAYARGDRRRSCVVAYRPRRKGAKTTYVFTDLFLATKAEKPFALFHYTGGKMYNVRIRALAKHRGYLLNQYGVFCEGPPPRRRAPGSSKIKTEMDLLRFLGATPRPPTDPKRAR